MPMTHTTLVRILAASTLLASVAIATAEPDPAPRDEVDVKSVIRKLNADPSVEGSEKNKSYKVLFDAYLNMTPSPQPVGPRFDMETIWPGMTGWAAVSAWAAENSEMIEAVLIASDRNIVGLPYGLDNVSEALREGGVGIAIGVGGNLRNIDFGYFHALDTVMAVTTAEIYRLMEDGQIEDGLELSLAQLFLLRQFCDREFIDEKLRGIEMLIVGLENIRDVFFTYGTEISAEEFATIAMKQIPFLRPDRSRLFLPEADRIIAEAMIDSVFDSRLGNADPEKFRETFAEIQSKDAPLSRFGSARRWYDVANLHGSREASLERLKLIYDDWWRLWRLHPSNPILARDSEYDETNEVRYAAVLFSIEDIVKVFSVRFRLMTEVKGTAVVAGLAAYFAEFGTVPSDKERIYGVSLNKSSDVDWFDVNEGPFQYRYINERTALNLGTDRVWLDPSTHLLYSVGYNFEDDRGTNHSTDWGGTGDLILWPPMKAILREQGKLK